MSFCAFGQLVQVNLFQKLLFLHQLTHNMVTVCSLNHKFNTWKFQAQAWGEHAVYINCFWHSEQFLYTRWSIHVLQKEELLTKNYLYQWSSLTILWLYIVLALHITTNDIGEVGGQIKSKHRMTSGATHNGIIFFEALVSSLTKMRVFTYCVMY